MKRMLILSISALLCLTLAACGEPIIVNQDAELEPLSEDTAYGADKSNISLADSSYMKRLQADTTIAKKLTLTAEETYQIEIPFDYEAATYSSDDPLIAAVSAEGLICGKSGGMTMVHITADDFQYHTVVTVDAALNIENTANPYAGFTLADFDTVAVEKAIELYASQNGMTIRSGLETADNLKYTDTFATADELTACEVKYKLLTTVDYLLSKQCKSMDLVIDTETDTITCRFYGLQ